MLKPFSKETILNVKNWQLKKYIGLLINNNNYKFFWFYLQKTFKIIEECTYSPGEMIFTEGEADDPAIFVVVQGKVEIFHSNPLKAGNEKSTSGNGLAPS